MDQTGLSRAICIVGTSQALAAKLSVTKAAITLWKRAGRVPARHCPQIERLTNRAVRCEELNTEVDWAFVRCESTQPAPE